MSPRPAAPGVIPPSPRTLPVYKSARDLAAYLCKFKTDHGITDTEMLMVLTEIQTQLIRHLVLGDRHPAEL